MVRKSHVRFDTLVRQIDLYRRALDECGKLFPKEMPIRRDVFVARTRDMAIWLCRPSLEYKYKPYNEWGQDKAMPEGENKFDAPFEELIQDRFLIGLPKEVAEPCICLADVLGVIYDVRNLPMLVPVKGRLKRHY